MGNPYGAGAGDQPGQETDNPASDNRLLEIDLHLEIERMLMDADRMMMQTMTLALSLIGFGFTINSFFNDAATRIAARGDQQARWFGIYLVILGLVFLSMGTWNQGRYRRELLVRYGAPTGFRALLYGRMTPPFVTAILMLVAGFGALGIMIFRRFL